MPYIQSAKWVCWPGAKQQRTADDSREAIYFVPSAYPARCLSGGGGCVVVCLSKGGL